MTRLLHIVFWFSFFGCAFARTVFAEPSYITFPSDVSWMTRNSEHFEIIYRRGQTEMAERTLKAAEHAHQTIAPLFVQLPEKTFIVLADFHDSMNGYAIDYPYPHMVLFAAPPEGSSTLSAQDEWLENLVLHEYTHVLHLYPTRGLWSVGKAIFGNWILPNGLMPAHLHEGLATFVETQFSRSGRGRGAEFSMFRRQAVLEGKWNPDDAPIDLFEGNVLDWPHGHSPYYFGYWAWREVFKRKGAPGIRLIVDEQSGNWPYLISSPFEKTLQADYPTLWKSIFESGKKEADEEIRAARLENPAELSYLTDSRHHKWDLKLSPDGKTLAWRATHPETGATIQLYSTESQQMKEKLEPEGGYESGMCLGRRDGKQVVLYIDSEYSDGYQTQILRSWRPESGDRQTLEGYLEGGTRTELKHLHAMGCSADLSRVILYREYAGHGEILELRQSNKVGEDIAYALNRKTDLPKGSWVSSVWTGARSYWILRDTAGSTLYEWSEGQPRKKRHLSTTHFFDLSSGGGDSLLMTGAASGRNELWRYNPATDELSKQIAVLGGLQSGATSQGRYWMLSYRHGGYDLASTSAAGAIRTKQPIPVRVERKPDFAAEGAPKPLRLSTEESYTPWETLWPRGWMPYLLIVPDGMQISAWIPSFDIAQKNTINFFGGYDTRGSPYFDLGYSYRFLRRSAFNVDTFFSPSYIISTRAFLKTWGGSVGFSTSIGKPTLSLSLVVRKLEASTLGAEKQNVGVSISLSHAFDFKSRPRAISPHRGTRFSLSYAHYFKALGSSDNYLSTSASLDQYFSSPWLGSHIFYIGARIGITDGTALYNSFFQGGGELAFSPGKGFFLNRGYLPGTFFGRRMFALNLEYRFPLFDLYRGNGLWPIFLERVHAALTYDISTQDYNNSTTAKTFFQTYYTSVGIELKSNWRFFYYFPTLIRFGAYHGFGPYGEPIYVNMAVEAGLF